jgi:hypothetical protein
VTDVDSPLTDHRPFSFHKHKKQKQTMSFQPTSFPLPPGDPRRCPGCQQPAVLWVPTKGSSFPGQYLKCPQASKNFNNPSFNQACKNFKENYVPWNGQPAQAAPRAAQPAIPPYPGAQNDYGAYFQPTQPAPPSLPAPTPFPPPAQSVPVDQNRLVEEMRQLAQKMDEMNQTQNALFEQVTQLNQFLQQRMMTE